MLATEPTCRVFSIVHAAFKLPIAGRSSFPSRAELGRIEGNLSSSDEEWECCLVFLHPEWEGWLASHHRCHCLGGIRECWSSAMFPASPCHNCEAPPADSSVCRRSSVCSGFVVACQILCVDEQPLDLTIAENPAGRDSGATGSCSLKGSLAKCTYCQ